MKILDRYIIKTFLGPFLFIFSVLFFIFMVNIIWQQMYNFIGKGFTYWEITKLLFLISASVVQMVMPLTILLSSIMTFGDLGERYELAAMKAAGISLTRVMTPLFGVTIVLSIVLFFFQNNITPDFQRKAINMRYNLSIAKPALNFTPGQFINQIPGFAVKFDEIHGENSEYVEGVFIHKTTHHFDNQQTVVAQRGKFAKAVDRNFLKLILYNGYVYEDEYRNNIRAKQPNQAVKFDSLVLHFDISEIINKSIENEQISDDYRFKTYTKINDYIEAKKKENDEIVSALSSPMVSNTNSYIHLLEEKKKTDKKIMPQYQLDSIKENKKLEVLLSAYNKIEQQKADLGFKREQLDGIVSYHNKMIMYQQRILAYSLTCIIFFMIGASLGSIIRKGGIGLPVVIAIVIFIIFFVINLSVENLSWKGSLNPYWAAWLPNLILFPFGVWLTMKALTDSQLFDAEKYKAFFKPIIQKFQKSKEHSRYQ